MKNFFKEQKQINKVCKKTKKKNVYINYIDLSEDVWKEKDFYLKSPDYFLYLYSMDKFICYKKEKSIHTLYEKIKSNFCFYNYRAGRNRRRSSNYNKEIFYISDLKKNFFKYKKEKKNILLKKILLLYLYIYRKFFINLILLLKNKNISIILLKSLYNNINKIEIINNNDYNIILNDNLLSSYKRYLIFFFFIKKNYIISCNYLSYMTCVDNLLNIESKEKNKKKRFCINYFFISLKNYNKLNVKINLNEINLGLVSLYKYFPNANWFEREIWDMFGIYFLFHKDLRRILTDYGFNGNPLKKDFPLTGYIELRYDDELKCLVYEEVELTQDYRFFNFLNSWKKI